MNLHGGADKIHISAFLLAFAFCRVAAAGIGKAAAVLFLLSLGYIPIYERIVCSTLHLKNTKRTHT